MLMKLPFEPAVTIAFKLLLSDKLFYALLPAILPAVLRTWNKKRVDLMLNNSTDSDSFLV